MKHGVRVTVVLLGLFLLSQLIGIAVLYNYIDASASAEGGKVVFSELPLVDRPEVEEETSYIPVIIAVLIGTVLALGLMKYKLVWIWKIWFLFAIVLALSISFNAFIGLSFAIGLALVLGVWRLFWPNFWVQSVSEVFLYGGLAAIFVPVFNLVSMSILMVLIALYDAYAVWKSKHMVTLAEGQQKQKVFAGLVVPYSLKGKRSVKNISKEVKEKGKVQAVQVKSAILGGGDMGFALLFAGVVLKEMGLWQSLVIPVFSTIGLAVLFYIGKKGRYYPAMPFIGGACFVGLAVVWGLGFLV